VGSIDYHAGHASVYVAA